MKFAIQAHPLYSATYFLILALGLKRLKQKSTMLIEKRQLDCKSLLALLRWRSKSAIWTNTQNSEAKFVLLAHPLYSTIYFLVLALGPKLLYFNKTNIDHVDGKAPSRLH